VRREPVAGDKRRVLVALTPAGRRLTGRLFERHVAQVVETFAPLGASEQEELALLCKRLGLATSL